MPIIRCKSFCQSVKGGVALGDITGTIDMGEPNMRECRRGEPISAKSAPCLIPASVPKYNIDGAVSRYSAVLKQASTKADKMPISSFVPRSAILPDNKRRYA
mgnify:CR=1 FL=1